MLHFYIIKQNTIILMFVSLLSQNQLTKEVFLLKMGQ